MMHRVILASVDEDLAATGDRYHLLGVIMVTDQRNLPLFLNEVLVEKHGLYLIVIIGPKLAAVLPDKISALSFLIVATVVLCKGYHLPVCCLVHDVTPST